MLTTAQVVETSVTENSLSEDCSHLDDHTRQTIDAIYHDINSGLYRLSLFEFVTCDMFWGVFGHFFAQRKTNNIMKDACSPISVKIDADRLYKMYCVQPRPLLVQPERTLHNGWTRRSNFILFGLSFLILL